MKQTDFKIGDTVKVIDAKSGCGHYLRRGTVVTIVGFDNYGAYATVQGTASSFRNDYGGWESNVYGKHCQAVGLAQIALTSKNIPSGGTHINPKMPII